MALYPAVFWRDNSKTVNNQNKINLRRAKMDYQSEYQKKLTTLEGAYSMLKDGDLFKTPA